jgi:tetratricopeptide (TPR) repeat protein
LNFNFVLIPFSLKNRSVFIVWLKILKAKTMKNFISALVVFVFPIITMAQNTSRIDNLIAAGRYDDAIDSLLILKKAYPNNPYVYFSLGETELKSYISDPFSDSKGNIVKKSLNYFKGGIKQDALNPLNYVGLGLIELFQNGDTTKADVNFNKALGMTPPKKKKITDLHIKTYLKLATAELYAEKPRFSKAESYITKLKGLTPNIPDVYIEYGDIRMAQKDASGAIMSYKKALYLKNEPLTNVLIAKIYSLARNLTESKKYYDNALALDSLFAPAYKGLGDLYYAYGQNKIANNYYAKFLKLTGNNIPAKVNYAKALYKAKDFDEAFKVTEDVLKVDSSKLFLYRIAAYSAFEKKPQDLHGAYFNMDKLFKKAHKDELINRDYIYFGKTLLELKRDQNDIRKGIEMLETAYQEDPSDNKLLMDILNSAFYIKDYNTVIKYLTIKIAINGASIQDYMHLGTMYYQNKEYTKADSVFGIVTTKDPTNIVAYLWRGYASSVVDPELKTGLAKPYFEKIVELASSDREKYAKELSEADSYLGSYYLFSAKPDLDKAASYYNQLIAINPKNNEWLSKGYYSLSIIYSKKKEYVKAKEYYQKILSIDPNDHNAKTGLRDVDKYLKAASNN